MSAFAKPLWNFWGFAVKHVATVARVVVATFTFSITSALHNFWKILFLINPTTKEMESKCRFFLQNFCHWDPLYFHHQTHFSTRIPDRQHLFLLFFSFSLLFSEKTWWYSFAFHQRKSVILPPWVRLGEVWFWNWSIQSLLSFNIYVHLHISTCKHCRYVWKHILHNGPAQAARYYGICVACLLQLNNVWHHHCYVYYCNDLNQKTNANSRIRPLFSQQTN